MAELSKALQTIWLHEGLFSDDLNDLGGVTKFGISLKLLKTIGEFGDIDHDGDIDRDDVQGLSKNDAANLYDIYFWSKYKYGLIRGQSIATKIFDFSINMGPSNSHRCLQRALICVLSVDLTEDGVLGPKTLMYLNLAKLEPLMASYKSEAAGYYRILVERNKKLSVFLKGWLNRAYSSPIIV